MRLLAKVARAPNPAVYRRTAIDEMHINVTDSIDSVEIDYEIRLSRIQGTQIQN